MTFVYDKENFNNPVNLEKVVGIFAPDTPTKKGKYYILFYLENNKNIFWLYENKESRDYIFINYLLPLFTFLGEK